MHPKKLVATFATLVMLSPLAVVVACSGAAPDDDANVEQSESAIGIGYTCKTYIYRWGTGVDGGVEWRALNPAYIGIAPSIEAARSASAQRCETALPSVEASQDPPLKGAEYLACNEGPCVYVPPR